MSHAHESVTGGHAHSYVPTGIAMVNTTLGQKPVQVMMCFRGHVRAVYIPKPIDQEEDMIESRPAKSGFRTEIDHGQTGDLERWIRPACATAES